MPALEPESNAEPRSDADLILGVRAGEVEAIDELYRRHHRAALAFAESVGGRVLAPDLVSDAFVRIIDVLKRGGGPDAVFRSYLYSTVRNLYVDNVRRHSRQISLPDFGPLEAELALGDGLDERFEHSLVRRAFRSLPERWQIALWCTTVEGVSLQDAGTYLGVAPNAVAALTFRAREGLRQAYLAEHLTQSVDRTCAGVWEALPRYVRGSLRAQVLKKVEEHLPTCPRCAAAAEELGEVNSGMRGILLVAFLGAGTAGYLDRALGSYAQGAPVGKQGHARVPGRTVRAVTAVAAAAVVGVLVLAWRDHHGAPEPRTTPTPPVSHSPTPTPPETRPGPRFALTPAAATPPPVGTETVALGTVSSTLLTITTPSWYHLVVPVSAPNNDVTLVVRVSSLSAFHVHSERGYGAWVCGQVAPVAGDPARRLTCHLPAGANGTIDLGLDLQVEEKVSVVITVHSSDATARTSAFVGE